MTEVERREALERIADEVRTCTRCRLHEGRAQAVPGEGHPSTEVLFVGEGPGLNEDRQGRPFVGAAGLFLTELIESVGWRREEVFITNVVKCRPPQNRDPEPDEIEACAPFLRRQLETLDPALVVTLGRHSMGRFMPGARIGGVHGTFAPAPRATGASDALAYAMYHPAAALHQATLRQTLLDDMASVPAALLEARRRREADRAALGAPLAGGVAGVEPEAGMPGVGADRPLPVAVVSASPLAIAILEPAPDDALAAMADAARGPDEAQAALDTAEAVAAPAARDTVESPTDRPTSVPILVGEPDVSPTDQMTLF